MKSMRSLIGIVLALALAAFAVPGVAGDKTFDLAATASVAVNQSITVTLTNRDDGNSSFNSLRITGAPGTGATLEIISASQTGSNKPGNPTISADKKSVTYTDLSPIKPQNPISVTLVVKTSTPTCSNGTIQWTGFAWTGSPSTPSNPFTTQDSPVTSISAGSCGVKFEMPPKKALKEQLITSLALDPTAAKVKVSVTVNGGAPQSATDVTLTSTCTSGTSMTPASYVKTMAAGSSSVEFDNLKSSTVATECTLKATTSALNPSTYYATAPTFDVVDADVVITGLPTSFALNTSTSIGAKLVIKDTSTVVPQTGGGTLTITGACTPSSLIAQNQTGGLISFGGVSGSTVGGTCAFTATATYNGATYTSSSYGPYQVFEKGDLACNTATALPDPPVPGAGYFAVLPTGVTSVTDVGFAAGYRAANDKSDCTYELIGYTFTNNIKGGFSTDGAGNTLPNNAVSFVWDEVKRPDGVFTYTLTFDYEYASVSTGLPVKRTKFCKLDTDVLGKPKPTDCTLASKQFELKACLGTDLKASSIPGTDPACIAREEWVTVSPINCPAWTDTGTMEPPACIRATARIIDARDPPIIR